MAELSRIAPLSRLRLVFGWMLLLMAAGATAQGTAAALERQVKAAYLFRFGAFVEWPDTSFARPDSPILIGVAGSEPLADELERMVAGRNVNGHPVKVRRVQPGDALADLHILFLDSSLERGAIGSMLAGARSHALLTVSDAAEALAQGCMINFLVAEDKLRFDVALRHVAPSRLRISARMLAVAHKVQGAS
jgi:hypothetical protein